MHFESTGEGQAIVFIHGLFGSLDNLKGLSKTLCDRYRTIRIDLPSHGQSSHTEEMDYPSMAAQLAKLLDTLQIPKTHLVGHSLGGKLAMAFALSYPDRVLSLTVADIAPVSYPPRHLAVFAALEKINLTMLDTRQSALTQLLSAGIDSATAQFLLKNLTKSEQGFRWKMDLAALQRNYTRLIDWPYAGQQQTLFTGPVLFVRGDRSDYLTADSREAVLKQFPHASVKTIVGTGHWLHAEKPAQFNRIVGRFIDDNAL